jgi:hypothetical protein
VSLSPLTEPSPNPSDMVTQMVDLLERHRDRHPCFDEELRRHRTIAQAIAGQQQRAEQALSDWQAALARRWACEVAAQRAYRSVQLQLDAYRHDAACSALLASALTGAIGTPRALLDEVRRLEAALELLSPRPTFAAEARTRLRAVGDELEAAIAQTELCEAVRRSLASEQRVVSNLLERSNERARQLLGSLEGEQL